jgi:D-alanyl-D-alanine carboxypeptidase
MRKLIPVIIFIALVGKLSGQSPKPEAFIDSYVKAHNFNGTILIKSNSNPIFKKSYGFANFAFKVNNTPDTKYKVASITKAFTAVLILQLYEAGKIDLEKSINTYLPDYTGDGGNRITITNLLNMTSGLRNMDEGTSMDSVLKNGIPQYQRPYTTDQMLVKYCCVPLVNEPGKEFDYNNADYIILGKIIERISGKSFENNLQEKILQPLQMYNSGMLSQRNIIDKLADTYFFRKDLNTIVNDLPVYIENWYASGAMYSTAADLLTFSDALFGKKLLKQETLNKMFISGPGEYGYGVWVFKDYEINHKMFTIIKRPGSIMGAQAMLFHILEEGSTIIILSNAGTTSLDDFAAEIAKQIIN